MTKAGASKINCTPFAYRTGQKKERIERQGRHRVQHASTADCVNKASTMVSCMRGCHSRPPKNCKLPQVGRISSRGSVKTRTPLLCPGCDMASVSHLGGIYSYTRSRKERMLTCPLNRRSTGVKQQSGPRITVGNMHPVTSPPSIKVCCLPHP